MSRLLVLLVAFDCISKVTALVLLPWRPFVDLDALFQFALQKNETGVGTAATVYFARFPLPDVLAGLLGYLGVTFAFIMIRRRRLGFWRRVAIAIAAYFVPAMLAQPAADALMKFSQPLTIGALRVTSILWIGTIWWLAPPGLWKLGLTLLLAAGIGNCLSLLYPPFRIVDFMYSWLTAKALRLGVFNLADLYIPVGAACLLAAAAQYIVRRFPRPRNARRSMPGTQKEPAESSGPDDLPR